MSGHSKWASIKHKKAATDAKRGKIYAKLVRAITVAAREGGGDPAGNSTLAQAIEKAKSFNMPADNIDRAIKKGTGELGGEAYESVTYEGYGPSGVAFIVECMTDNRNRTAADVRHTFSKRGGNVGTPGSVAWMFERKGHLLVDKDKAPSEDDLLAIAIDAGAEDMRDGGDQWEILTEPTELMTVDAAVKNAGIEVELAEITMLPKTSTNLDIAEARKVLRLVEDLEGHDDVQEVFANFDISDEVMNQLAEED
ncbi:MAG: YebC/PmpR family DNA-binding transcriptional regulator [Actinobacteria bacterium]|nr:YebC/PmpR family DNA-binding transcriptional regulator [Chloroflexota bacterium]MCL5292621.1 YebC/PmpR family DNA-binding transcriptional regulator [Actinomycetota bacterium]